MAFFQRNAASGRSGSSKSRRPQGTSRRQRKRQLGFETLEDRRVMSAESPLAALQGGVDDGVQFQVQSYSSATAAGQAQIFLNELYWQSLLGNASQQVKATSFAIPTDPLSGNQWQFINVAQEVGNPDFQAIFGKAGEDINVAPVWNLGIDGSGVVVAVIDTGVQLDHPDLEANISTTLQLDPLTGDGNASPEGDPHGTAVAGLIGAVANNGLGGSGVAPGVELVPIRLIDAGQTEQAFIDAFRYATDEIDITNNSWGPGVTRGVAGPTFDEFLALRDSVIFGRTNSVTGEDLGVIHVFASGNNAGTPFDFGFETIGGWDSSTYNGWVSSRYTIGVTGVDHDGFYNNVDGTITGYPETGANVLVAAPTGSNAALNIADDSGLGSGIFTTDITGEGGYNIAPDPVTGQEFDRDFLADTDYTSRFNGTSASAPLVSGVIALMLEVNPDLSWRDVQEILVRSARQNAKFDIPIAAGVGTTQNTWIVNQTPVFSDPDVWNPAIAPLVQTLTPTLDPTLTFSPGPGPTPNFVGTFLNSQASSGIFYQATPQVLTNGAGYTVSQGRGVYGETIGYAQGVIDAELAVQLAQQWSTKNQSLPDELTFTSFINPEGGFFINVPAAEVATADGALDQLVPGGLGGGEGFIGFWNEYFADIPFDNNPLFQPRGGYVELEVPANNTMTIETVEVKISLVDGTDTQFLDNMRVLLVSPSGMQSELNAYFVEDQGQRAQQNFSAATFEENPALVSTDTDPDNPLVVTFSTNRNWGERSDSQIIFDPTTGEPADVADLLEQGWQLHFENYSATSIGISGIEVVWHGSPIGANTQRVQGLIGVDDNRDDAFNFSRVIQNNADTDGVLRFGEVTNTIDITHESMGANITVTARRASDGVIVDQFVTGADGNYYFDLVPDDYIISIEDPLGRASLDDSFTAAGFLQDYKDEWTISADFFKAWDYDANLEVPLQADGTPFAFLDGSGAEVVTGVKNLNFLLDPGAPAAAEVDFSGVVFADINGDGNFNAGDVNVPGVSVYGDVNRNGQFDAGEVIVSTNANGQYSLTVPLDPNLDATVVNVGVIAPPSWTLSDPSEGVSAFFVEHGDAVSGVDFAITPPVGTGPGNGTSQDGYLMGVVFIDSTADGIQQSNEIGQVGVDVFIDSNGSGSFEIGEQITTTNVNGAYIFDGVAPGTHVVRIETTGTPFFQTFPLSEGPQIVSLAGGGTVSNILFGLFGDSSNPTVATLDYGDLPAAYGITLFAEDGARHPMGVFFLGSSDESIDAEINGLPSPDADGDDNDNFNDDDGIVVDDLVAGGMGSLVATASRTGGYLQGWVDFNGDNDFDDPGERIITDELLQPGDNTISFDIPAVLTAGDVFARFRYGEYGIDSVTGVALIGEVEDYKLRKVAPITVVIAGPDFDNDNDVDGFDFLSWQLGFGNSGAEVTAADGDSNGDNVVNAADLADWNAEYGTGSAAATAVTGDYDEDGDTDGFDFLSWQTGFGIAPLAASLSEGDGNSSSTVDAVDLSIWSSNYGENTGGVPAAAMAGEEEGGSSSPILAAAQAPQASSVSLEQSSVGSSSSLQFPAAALSSSVVTTLAPAPATVASARAVSAAAGRGQSSTRIDATILTLARQTRSAEDLDLSRAGRLSQPLRFESHRFETRSIETRIDRAADFADRVHAVNDQVMDRLAGRRERSFDEVIERAGRDAESALTEVLGKEINWRFL